MRKNLLVIPLVLMAIFSIAQEDSDCSKTLKKAQLTYDAGEIEKVEVMLKKCLEEDGFTLAEKTEAEKLIILSKLFEDDIPSAEIMMIDLLKINPDFKPKSNDHQELKDLYSRFRTDPLLILDYTVGLNFTDATISRYYTLNYESPYFKNYYTKIGANVGVVANYLITKNIRANLGINYKNQNFGIYEFFGYDGSGFEVDDYQAIDAQININLLGFQLGATKEFGRRKVVPFIGTGIFIDAYLSSSHLIERSYQNNEASIANVTGPKVSSLALVKGNNSSIYSDIGLRYKIGLRGKLIFSIKTAVGINNQTYQNNRYNNPELVYKYYFIPDDYLLHNMSINIGYSQLIFKPKKLK